MEFKALKRVSVQYRADPAEERERENRHRDPDTCVHTHTLVHTQAPTHRPAADSHAQCPPRVTGLEGPLQQVPPGDVLDSL